MATTLTEIIAKVQKLLSLSKNNSNAAEAAAAAGIANRLIDEHRLSVADLEAEYCTEEPVVQDENAIYESGRVTAWRSGLVRVLTTHYGVAYYNDVTQSATGRQVSRYRMVGRKSDMEICRYMYTWLGMECERLSGLEAKGMKLGRVYVASYQDGFVSGIQEQLRLSREEIKKEATSTSIVMIDSRGEESRAGMYAIVPGLRKSKARSASQFDANAFGQGKARGKAMHLGNAMGSSGSAKALNG